MKTNQNMLVRIGDYTQSIEHLTMMGHLNSLWDYGNSLRAIKKLPRLDMQNWLRSPQTIELILAIEQDLYSVESTEYKIIKSDKGITTISGKLHCVKTKQGKGGGTWVHLYLLLDAAAWLDAGFRLQLYKTFVTSKILQWRDESGDEYNNLNAAVDSYLPGRELKLDNKGIYIQCAKMIKAKIKPDGDTWNTASFFQLEQRTKVENKLVEFLRMGLITDWEHLKQVIEKL